MPAEPTPAKATPTEPRTTRAADAPQDQGAMPHRHVMLVYFGLLFAMLMATLDSSIVATALPTVVGDLGGLSSIGWVSAAYILASSAVMPLAGKLGDLLGRKQVFVVATVVFLAGSAACGAAQTMGQLIAFRVLQGVGAGGVMAAMFALTGDLFGPRERAKYQGYSAGVFALSAVGGPIAGGFFADHVTWRWVFYVNLPIGAIALTLVALYLRSARRPERPTIDYLGMLLLSGALVSFVLLSNWAGAKYAWGSAVIVGLAVGGVVLLAGWLVVERSAAEPVIPLGLFRDSTFDICNVVAFVGGLTGFGLVFFLPLYLQISAGASATNSGLLLLPMMLGLMLASFGVGGAVAKSGRYKWYPVASMLVSGIAAFLMSTMTADTSRFLSGLYMFLLGVGAGLSQQVVVVAVQNAAPPADMGAATSTVTFSRMLGTSFGVSIFATVLTDRLTREIPKYVPGEAARGLVSSGGTSPQALRQLPDDVRHGLAQAYAHALSPVFLIAGFVLVAGLVASVFLKDITLEQRGWGAEEPPETPNATARPAPQSS
ncbi:MDR family MFS transporter [Kitasatospora aureofaciens]|uniref:MDR family MFS transporter n=1 Tax=Kitasatospora aureofaciens TaxID=1894 RepID=UPI003824E80E